MCVCVYSVELLDAELKIAYVSSQTLVNTNIRKRKYISVHWSVTLGPSLTVKYRGVCECMCDGLCVHSLFFIYLSQWDYYPVEAFMSCMPACVYTMLSYCVIVGRPAVSHFSQRGR